MTRKTITFLILIFALLLVLGCQESKHRPIDAYLTVESDHGDPDPPVGNNYLNYGMTITATVDSSVGGEAEGTRYVCAGWTGTGSTPETGNTNSCHFTITQNSTITWTWQTQHYLTIDSLYGDPQGERWYDEGETAHWSVTSPWPGGTGVRHIASSLTSGDMVMDSPKIVTIAWTTQYELKTTVFPAGAGTITVSPIAAGAIMVRSEAAWCDEGASVLLTASAYDDYRFKKWAGGLTGPENLQSLRMVARTNVMATFASILPRITTTFLPDAPTMKKYEEVVRAEGGFVPYIWDIPSGTLPTGLLIDPASGAIFGIPTVDGTYNFTVRCTDAMWAFDTQNFTVSVRRDWTEMYPSRRYGHAMAYDSVRGVTVMFGGDDLLTGLLDDTWEWDGMTWTQRHPANKPPARSGHVMAYDSAREVVVLFGGNGRNDTWEWNGSDWTQRFPANKPSGRSEHAMVYDCARAVTLLFGGDSGSTVFGDTWEWDGTDWTQASTANYPLARSLHAMAYDSARAVTVLFGGRHGYSRLDDTWEWDGSNWTEMSPANKPSGREQHAMAYDSARAVTVLFGGLDGSYLDDIWGWDGTDWTYVSVAGRPHPRDEHAMAYDSARAVVALFGGYYDDELYGASYYGDTWEWNGANWSRRGLKPSGRFTHAMAYDSARAVTVMFGGYDSTPVVFPRHAWEWDGTNWTEKSVMNEPAARMGHAMAYDSTRAVTVLFGGYDLWDTYDDTWEWDGTNWSQKSPTNKPSAGGGHAMAYDSSRGVTVLFGGTDTWEWDGTNWNQRIPASKPSARDGHAMAYDSAHAVVVLFGGEDATGRLNDTWEWSGTNWSQKSPANKPSAREDHAMAYDSPRAVVVLFGGQDSTGRLNDTWEWDGSNWRQVSPANNPSERYLHTMAYDSARGVTVLFGGYPYLDDTWEY